MLRRSRCGEVREQEQSGYQLSLCLNPNPHPSPSLGPAISGDDEDYQAQLEKQVHSL